MSGRRGQNCRDLGACPGLIGGPDRSDRVQSGEHHHSARRGICARMAWYFRTLLMTVPPSSRIRVRTAGVMSARMSTITRSFLASGSVVWRREIPAAVGFCNGARKASCS